MLWSAGAFDALAVAGSSLMFSHRNVLWMSPLPVPWHAVSPPAVDLVQLHDASWSLSPGAAAHATEAEAAEVTRHHEPTPLRAQAERSTGKTILMKTRVELAALSGRGASDRMCFMASPGKLSLALPGEGGWRRHSGSLRSPHRKARTLASPLGTELQLLTGFSIEGQNKPAAGTIPSDRSLCWMVRETPPSTIGGADIRGG